MVTTIKKWGNSLALRIPNTLARDMYLFPGSMAEMTIVDGKIIIKPEGQRKISLSKMLKGITKNNRHSVQNCSGAAGREIL
ncbi:MAG: AbrB/MazE/SpoVT family DNA-binding domain-containing protein [Elusimicrobiota bacterium]|nr:AbrB/MazE/SpoVT family DNA-binding domain-containing protein [Elusimicrobiota bacterium]